MCVKVKIVFMLSCARLGKYAKCIKKCSILSYSVNYAKTDFVCVCRPVIMQLLYIAFLFVHVSVSGIFLFVFKNLKQVSRTKKQ